MLKSSFQNINNLFENEGSVYFNTLFFVKAIKLKPFGWSVQFSGCLSPMMFIPEFPAF